MHTSFAAHLAAIAVGYLPVIGFYLWLGFHWQAFDAAERIWVMAFQFLGVEFGAGMLVATLGFALARGPEVRERSGHVRRVSPRERHASLLGLGVVLVIAAPVLIYAITSDIAKAVGIAAALLPRAIDLWRHRDACPRRANALAWGGMLGPVLLIAFFGLAVVADRAGVPGSGGGDSGWRQIGALIAAYYALLACGNAWLQHRRDASEFYRDDS